MTQPENYTAAQASDPRTSGQTLADIAAQRPDLRPAVAANPSAYPALLDWLRGLGEPAVDAALASRAQATQVLPAQPTGPLAPPAPSWAGGPPSGAPASAGPPTSPGAPGYGPTYGAVPTYASAPPQGMPPGGMTPGYAGTPPKKSNRTLWIVLIIVGVVLLLGGVILVLILNAARDVVDDANDEISDIVDDANDGLDDTTTDDPMSFGDDPTLDALYTACGEGDWQACDDLYEAAPVDSEYFQFADTCGGQWESGTTTYCVEAMAGDDGGDTTTGAVGEGAAEQAYFAALSEACSAQEWAACDELYWQSPSGSAEEELGSTCGGAAADGTYGNCSGLLGGADYQEPMVRGSSRFLDMLWDACESGDAQACEALYMNSPVGSEYETFAESQQ